MMKRSAIHRALTDAQINGLHAIEWVAGLDIKVTVTVAGLQEGQIKLSRNVVIVADTTLDKVSEQLFDAIILPGGLGGSAEFRKSEVLGKMLKNHEKEGRILAGICAGPTAFAENSIALGKSLTSYPTAKSHFADKYNYVDDQPIVRDGQLLTSRGPGTATLWSLTLAEMLAGKDKAQEVAKQMLLNSDYKL